jgi:hypothetical protein
MIVSLLDPTLDVVLYPNLGLAGATWAQGTETQMEESKQ